MQFLKDAATELGPKGALTALQILELQELLASYLLTRFSDRFCADELEEIAREAVVTHQAQHHAQLTAPDVRAQGDQVGDWLLRLATDRALDEMAARQSLRSVTTPKPPPDACDDEFAALIFGSDTKAADVRKGLCALIERRDPTACRVVVCYLEVAEHTNGDFSDQDVVARAGIPGLRPADVRRIMLQFANRLGRE